MLTKMRNKKGFTLMEMLIVIAIIAVLVAIAIPTFSGALTKAKQGADVANIRALYAEWQIAMLTDEAGAPSDRADFLKGPKDGAGLTLNYLDNLAFTEATKEITYTCNKLVPASYSWTLNPLDIS